MQTIVRSSREPEPLLSADEVLALPSPADDYHPYDYAALLNAGMTPEQAFDEVAKRAAAPAVQAVIKRCNASHEGQGLLALLCTSWEEVGFPAPWDNVLDLRPRAYQR
ncbi:MAG: hypothetical protein H0X37_01740 [Herpetosiphonaceae bacterium]|nr:hypothetical protein [Herpetosiphonaceae bacterium]